MTRHQFSTNLISRHLITGKLARDIPSSLEKLSKLGRVPSNIGKMTPSNIPSAPAGPTGPTGIQTNIPTMGIRASDGEDSFYTGRLIFKKHLM